MRRPLRVAAGNYYFASGILAAYPADGGASVLLGGSCYSTGIKHHKARALGMFGPSEAPFAKLLLYGRTVRLSGSATEIFYVKTWHFTILAYVDRSILTQPSPNRTRGTHEAQNFTG